MKEVLKVEQHDLGKEFERLANPDFQETLKPEQKHILNNFLADMEQQDILLRNNMVVSYDAIEKAKEDLDDFSDMNFYVYVVRLFEQYNNIILHLKHEREKYVRILQELITVGK